jgi:hypothetical protein
MMICGYSLKALLGGNMISFSLPVTSLTGCKDFLLSYDLNFNRLTLHIKEASSLM